MSAFDFTKPKDKKETSGPQFDFTRKGSPESDIKKEMQKPKPPIFTEGMPTADIGMPFLELGHDTDASKVEKPKPEQDLRSAFFAGFGSTPGVKVFSKLPLTPDYGKYQDFEPATTGEKIAYGAGEALGDLPLWIGSYGTAGAKAAEQVAKNLSKQAAQKLLPKLGIEAARGAGAGMLVSPVQSLAKKETPEEALQRLSLNVGLGAVLDAGLVGAGISIKSIINKLRAANPKATVQQITDMAEKEIAQQLGVKWEDLNEKQKQKIRQLSERILEGPTLSQKRLQTGQDFTFRDLTPEESIARVMPERPLALPAPEQNFVLQGEPYRMPTKKVPKEFDRTPIPEKTIDLIDAKYKSQYNTEKEIKNQLRKYYSGFDKEGLDEAAKAISDLRKTELDIQRGKSRQGNTRRRETGIQGEKEKPYKTVGLSFSKDLIDTGKVNLTGHKIRNTEDLAVIAQVFRDPRFETFRIIYTKGNQIVGTDAISSRIPSFAAAFLDNFDKYALKTKVRMKRLEADGYYFLHNHPTGRPDPSQADIDVTYRYAKTLPGFKEHIIINSNKYSVIFPDYSSGQLQLRGNENVPLDLGEDRLLKSSIGHPLLGRKVSNSHEFAALAKAVQKSNDIAVAFFMNAKNEVRGIQEVNKKMFNDKNFRNFLRNQAREHGGANTFIVGDSSIENELKKLVASGDVMDAYLTDTKTALRDYISPTPTGIGDWMGLSAEKTAKNLKPPKPYQDTTYRIPEFKPAEKASQQPLLLPEPKINFTLQDEPLQFKKTVAGPLEKGTAVKPPIEEPPLLFKKTIEVPRTIDKEKAFIDLPEGITQEISKRMSGVEMISQRPPSGKVSGESSGGIVSRKVMIDRLLKQLDIPSRVGRISQKHALGIFKVKPEVIRTKLAEDMPVISHEVGHYLDKMFDIRGSVAKNKVITQELIELGKTQPANHFTEGIAEYMRRYLTGEDVSKLAPEFSKWFENTVSKETKIWDALQQFRQDYIDYMTASAAARVKAAISTSEKGRRKLTVDGIMKAAVDDLRPIDSYVQKVTGGGKKRAGLKTTEDPFVQAWLFRGWMGKARNALHYGVMDAGGNKIGPSFREIVKPVANRIDDFRAYIVAKRAVELHGRNINPGVELKDAQETIKHFDLPEFKKAHEQLKQFQDNIMNMLVESGVLSQDQVAAMRKLNQEYVPFYRVFDENAGGIGFGKRGFADLHSPVKKMKGSGRTIVDPLESIVKNTYYLTRIAEQNKVGRTLVDFAQKFEGAGKFVEKVPPKMYPVEFSLGEIEKALREIGVELPKEALSEITKIFKPQMAGSPKENIIAVFKNGKQELYQLDPDLYRAVLMLDREATNTFIKLLSYPTSWLRAGAILSPEFMLRNPMRDTMGAWVYSKYGFIPGIDTARGLFHVLGKSDLYQKWLQSGGAMANFVSLDRNYLQQDLRQLMTTSIWQKMKQYATHPLEVLRALSEFSEEATRLGEFAKGVQKEGITVEGLQKSALASRDVTLDFGRMGTVGKPANQLIAFFNAAVQGVDKMRRVFTQGSTKDKARATMKAILGITMPSIALWFLNHDNPKYQELPEWRKDLFWNIITDKYTISIPKPFEMGVIFGTLPERILDWTFNNDPDAMKKFGHALKEITLPNWIPTALLPAIEVASNYSFFRDAPITPQSEESLLKQEQFGPYTTEAAKTISKALAGGGEAPISPREIETLVRGYGGGLGGLGLEMISAFIPEEAPMPEKDFLSEKVPGIRGILAEHYRGSASIDDFYQRLEELEKKAKTAKKYQEAGKPVPEKLQYNTYELQQMRKVQRTLADLRKQKNEIFKSKNMTPKQKKEALDRINMQMINVARQVLGKEVINQ